MKVSDLRTPAFLVDLDKVQRNCKSMVEICRQAGVTLRPHMKTHRTLEAGQLMTDGTRRQVVVSTLSEAEFYADNGFDDIAYAYPLTADKIPQVARLTSRLEKFHVNVDNSVILSALDEYTSLPADKKWSVFLKVDCGNKRAGVWYDDPGSVELAKSIVDKKNTTFAGVYLHCGDSYGCRGEGEIKQSGAETHRRLLSFVQRLKEAGIHCPAVATGSTPNCSKPCDNIEGITEFHPGNYVFYDYQQVLIGSCKMEDVAVRVLTRVIGHYPHRNQLLVDCGWTALSHDSFGRLPTGFCIADGNPNLKLSSMTQEIGKVETVDGSTLDFSQHPIGSFLRLVPYHSCATAYMHPVFYVHQGEEVVQTWVPNRGW